MTKLEYQKEARKIRKEIREIDKQANEKVTAAGLTGEEEKAFRIYDKYMKKHATKLLNKLDNLIKEARLNGYELQFKL